jgi:hypothetical protein
VKVYIGHDCREAAAYEVARKTLQRVSGLDATPLVLERLAAGGLLRRPMDRRGQLYDIPSNAPCSTEFASSRFLVPMLAQTGWALFVDCDVVFLADPRQMLAYADPSKAVLVVQHRGEQAGGLKMDGQVQTLYPRKNWSSVMLFNCDHPANQRLSLQDINERPGRDLHRFYWLSDDEIGSLPAEWNWLVGEQVKPAHPKIAHFTRGGPWFPTWPGAEHDELWLEASRG